MKTMIIQFGPRRSIRAISFVFYLSCVIASLARAEIEYDAAILYQQALASLPVYEFDNREKSLWVRKRELTPVDEELKKLARRFDNTFHLLQKAAKAEGTPDWKNDNDERIRILYVASAGSLRLRVHLASNDEAAVLEEMLAMLTMARLASTSSHVSLVSIACEAETVVVRSAAENFGKLSKEANVALRERLQKLPPRGSIARATAADKGWLSNALANDDSIIESFIDHPDERPEYADLGERDQAVTNIREHSQDTLRVYEQLLNAMHLPYAEFILTLKRINDEPAGSENLLLHRVLIPGLTVIRFQEFRTDLYFCMLLAAVEYRLNGHDGVRSVADPYDGAPFTINWVSGGFELSSRCVIPMEYGSEGGKPLRLKFAIQAPMPSK